MSGGAAVLRAARMRFNPRATAVFGAGYTITCRTIETVGNAQEVGAIGTALVVAAGIKKTDVLELSQQLIQPNRSYHPDLANKEVYERNYRVFKKLYKSNAAGFKDLNT